MSLYNIVNGASPAAPLCLQLLKLDTSQIPRLRDAWFNADGKTYTILTRTGGGNREGYAEENAKLAAHPNYVYDHNDDFDSTFAHFVFKLPEKFEEPVKRLCVALDAVKKGSYRNGPGSQIFNELFDDKNKEEIKRDDPRVEECSNAAFEVLALILKELNLENQPEPS